MIDHIGLQVSDIAASLAFYRPTLAALGFGLVAENSQSAGFGPPGMPLYWIYQAPAGHQDMHIALKAGNRRSVDAFHAAALAAGGVDNGAPGLRPNYHEHYYAAFARDPDGNNIEAVCHLPAD